MLVLFDIDKNCFIIKKQHYLEPQLTSTGTVTAILPKTFLTVVDLDQTSSAFSDIMKLYLIPRFWIDSRNVMFC